MMKQLLIPTISVLFLCLIVGCSKTDKREGTQTDPEIARANITAHLKFQFEQIPFSSGLFRDGISCLVVPDDLQGVHAFGGPPLAA